MTRSRRGALVEQPVDSAQLGTAVVRELRSQRRRRSTRLADAQVIVLVRVRVDRAEVAEVPPFSSQIGTET